MLMVDHLIYIEFVLNYQFTNLKNNFSTTLQIRSSMHLVIQIEISLLHLNAHKTRKCEYH